MFQAKIVEKIKIHILRSTTSFSKIFPFFWVNVEIYCRAGQTTDDEMALAHCMLCT